MLPSTCRRLADVRPLDADRPLLVVSGSGGADGGGRGAAAGDQFAGLWGASSFCGGCRSWGTASGMPSCRGSAWDFWSRGRKIPGGSCRADRCRRSLASWLIAFIQRHTPAETRRGHGAGALGVLRSGDRAADAAAELSGGKSERPQPVPVRAGERHQRTGLVVHGDPVAGRSWGACWRLSRSWC